MKIAVCVSYVPDTASKIKISQDEKSIDPTGITFILNPYDEYAIEEALKIKEKAGGEVNIYSVGGEGNKESIRKALAMGADNGILLKTNSYTDSFIVANSLADELKKGSYDLIFFGKQSVDFDNSITGQLTAELLNYNCITVVVKLIVDGNKVTAEREIEGGKEVVESELPVVITAQKGLNEPRYASLKGIMAAKKKVIEEKDIPTGSNKVEILKLKTPPPKKPGRIIGTDLTAVPELITLLHEEAKVI